MREWGVRLLRETGRFVGSVGALGVLVVVGVLVAGAVVGSVHPGRGASVDASDPPSAVVADGVRELTWQNYRVTTTMTYRNPNRTVRYRAVTAIDHNRRFVRYEEYGRQETTEGPVSFGPPTYVVFSGDGHMWQRVDGRWHRLRTGFAGPLGYEASAAPLIPPAAIERLPFRTVERNRTALVLRGDTTLPLREPAQSHLFGANTTATAVVDLEGDPSLRRLTFRNESAVESTALTYRIRGVGETTVERPAPMPPVSTTELLYRAGFGLRRIADWLNLS